ncbi:hypothetical protein HK405_010522 [Cladochytrium tenue]|nr:hypothetical protein HK405_010522 [Cladochytrium tenue]
MAGRPGGMPAGDDPGHGRGGGGCGSAGANPSSLARSPEDPATLPVVVASAVPVPTPAPARIVHAWETASPVAPAITPRDATRRSAAAATLASTSSSAAHFSPPSTGRATRAAVQLEPSTVGNRPGTSAAATADAAAKDSAPASLRHRRRRGGHCKGPRHYKAANSADLNDNDNDGHNDFDYQHDDDHASKLGAGKSHHSEAGTRAIAGEVGSFRVQYLGKVPATTASAAFASDSNVAPLATAQPHTGLEQANSAATARRRPRSLYATAFAGIMSQQQQEQQQPLHNPHQQQQPNPSLQQHQLQETPCSPKPPLPLHTPPIYPLTDLATSSTAASSPHLRPETPETSAQSVSLLSPHTRSSSTIAQDALPSATISGTRQTAWDTSAAATGDGGGDRGGGGSGSSDAGSTYSRTASIAASSSAAASSSYAGAADRRRRRGKRGGRRHNRPVSASAGIGGTAAAAAASPAVPTTASRPRHSMPPPASGTPLHPAPAGLPPRRPAATRASLPPPPQPKARSKPQPPQPPPQPPYPTHADGGSSSSSGRRRGRHGRRGPSPPPPQQQQRQFGNPRDPPVPDRSQARPSGSGARPADVRRAQPGAELVPAEVAGAAVSTSRPATDAPAASFGSLFPDAFGADVPRSWADDV